MKQRDFCRRVATKIDTTITNAERVTEAVLETFKEELAAEGKIFFPGFGTFTVTEREAYTARNPTTGEPVAVPTKRNVKFKAAKALKDYVA